MRQPIESNRAIVGPVHIKDDFWSPKLDTFFRVTLPDSFDKFEADGTLENYRDVAAGKRGTHRGNPWHDGLLGEMIRGAADYIARGETDPKLEERIDGYIDIMEKAQDAAGGGYLHTMVLLNRPTQQYGENGGDILWQHDLYDHGCLIEAGVHYYRATGKTKLLRIALRAANELCRVIGEPPKKWIVPGHELPSYAMLELYALFMDEPELVGAFDFAIDPEEFHRLAKFWVFGRGQHERRANHPQYMGEYSQDHAPIHEQYQAVGHAVRATLYYTGVTREAMVDGDRQLLEDSLRIWNNVETRKLHINGGIGATHFEEKFGTDYDLVNTAYLETCATVGLIYWAESLSRATGDARFYQVIERALYNLMLSSVTLQGDAYFYRNPLSSDGNDHHWAWHSCPCCPPMIHKTFGMFDKFIYAQSDEGLYVNLFVSGTAETRIGDNDIAIDVGTKIPWDGAYTLSVTKGAPFTLFLRVPEWKTDLVYYQNSQIVSPEIKNGYAVFHVQEGDRVGFTDPMRVRRIEAHPYVGADRGRVAFMRGPIVYCVEGIDNHGNTDITIAKDPACEAEFVPDLLGGVTVLRGLCEDGKTFTAVPLYVWDNRMACSMDVWLKQAGKEITFDTAGWDGLLYREYNG